MGHLSPAILDLMGFVQANDIPFPQLDILGAVDQNAIGTKDHIVRPHIIDKGCPVLHLIYKQRAKSRSEFPDFALPVGNDGCGSQHQRRALRSTRQ